MRVVERVIEITSFSRHSILFLGSRSTETAALTINTSAARLPAQPSRILVRVVLVNYSNSNVRVVERVAVAVRLRKYAL